MIVYVVEKKIDVVFYDYTLPFSKENIPSSLSIFLFFPGGEPLESSPAPSFDTEDIIYGYDRLPGTKKIKTVITDENIE